MQQPDTDDFWLMAEVVLDLDAAADDGLSLERIFNQADTESVAYMAVQRAIRLGQPDPARLALGGRTTQSIEAAGAAWMEGFIIGMEFRRRRDARSDRPTAPLA